MQKVRTFPTWLWVIHTTLHTSTHKDTRSHSPVTMRLLHSTSRWRTLAGSFGGQLLTGSFASSRFTGGLLSTSHVFCSPVSDKKGENEYRTGEGGIMDPSRRYRKLKAKHRLCGCICVNLRELTASENQKAQLRRLTPSNDLRVWLLVYNLLLSYHWLSKTHVPLFLFLYLLHKEFFMFLKKKQNIFFYLLPDHTKSIHKYCSMLSLRNYNIFIHQQSASEIQLRLWMWNCTAMLSCDPKYYFGQVPVTEKK